MEKAIKEKCQIDIIISYMQDTKDDDWCLDVVRSESGDKNCFFGHLFNMGSDEKESNALWDAFEHEWATTYMIYPINDGSDPKYQQDTPKERVLAYLRDLRDKKTKCTRDYMKEMESYHKGQ